MKKIIQIIYIFAKLGLQMLGNIASMFPILEEELVNKENLVKREDILDSLALGRCGPGAAVINTIVFLGNKIYGFWGGGLAAFSFCIFPCIIIILISMFIDQFLKNPLVISSFKAISVSLSVMIIKSIYNLAKDALISKITIVIFIITVILSIFTNIFSIIYIIFSVFLGIIIEKKDILLCNANRPVE